MLIYVCISVKNFGRLQLVVEPSKPSMASPHSKIVNPPNIIPPKFSGHTVSHLTDGEKSLELDLSVEGRPS